MTPTPPSKEYSQLFETIKEGVEKLEKLKKNDPVRYKRDIKELVAELKRYNDVAKDVVAFYKDNVSD